LQHYLDYDALKQSIKACAEAQRAAAQQQGPPLSTRALLEDSQAKFQSQLDAEVLKVVGFYQQHSAQLLEVSCFLLCCRRCIPAALGLRWQARRCSPAVHSLLLHHQRPDFGICLTSSDCRVLAPML
jgi:hypothetical protein